MKPKLVALLVLLILGPFATEIPCFKLPGLEVVAKALSVTQEFFAFVLWTIAISYLYKKRGGSWKEVILEAALLNLLVLLFKCAFHSPRPLAHPKGFCDWEALGYPSGHTARATWVSLWLSELLGNKAVLLYAVLVGWSRIELCKHYPLDVVGGFLLGYITYKLIVEVLTRTSQG